MRPDLFAAHGHKPCGYCGSEPGQHCTRPDQGEMGLMVTGKPYYKYVHEARRG